MNSRWIGAVARGAISMMFAFTALSAMADADALRAKYTQVREQLRANPYHRPLVIESAESGDALKGDVYAMLDHPFDEFEGALKQPNDWCAILILPFNTKYCHPVTAANGAAVLTMRIGRKADQPVSEAYRVDFALRPVAAASDYFESRLTAAQGPVGTRDYRITLEAVPLDSRHTFMHFAYSYATGGVGRFAMQAYLNTAGRDKVGFSVVGKDGNGEPIYIGGVRGAIERNVMRYYLAIDSYMASLSAPPDEQLDKRIDAWFNSSERYARQLHEMDKGQYVAMKKGEYERQQAMIE